MEGFAEQLQADLSPRDVRHVLAVFAADLGRLMDVLGETARAGEAASFGRAAHALAGAAGAVGAAALELACRAAITAPPGGAMPLSLHFAAMQAAAREAETDLATTLARLGA